MRRIEEEAPTAAHWNEDEYNRIFAGDPPRLALVIHDDTVQGFLIANQIGPEWELENVVVAAGARRRGLASALLGHFLDVVKQQGSESVFLEVRASLRRSLIGVRVFTAFDKSSYSVCLRGKRRSRVSSFI